MNIHSLNHCTILFLGCFHSENLSPINSRVMSFLMNSLSSCLIHVYLYMNVNGPEISCSFISSDEHCGPRPAKPRLHLTSQYEGAQESQPFFSYFLHEHRRNDPGIPASICGPATVYSLVSHPLCFFFPGNSMGGIARPHLGGAARVRENKCLNWSLSKPRECRGKPSLV